MTSNLLINDQPQTKNSSWRALQIFSLYRLLLSIVFVAFIQLKPETNFLGSYNSSLFKLCSIVYLVLTLTNHIATYHRKFFSLQLQFQVIVDIVLLTLLMHTSGGISSGLGMLIAVSTTAAAILLTSPSALGFAVAATFAIVIEEFYSTLHGIRGQSGLNQIGILTVTILATSLLAFYLSRRIKESEIKAEQSIKGLASMEKLNEEIIQYMSTGVIVTDSFHNIRLINQAAWVHLGMPESTQNKRLDQIATPLARQLNLWRRKNFHRPKAFRNTVTGPTLLPHFSAIGNSKENAIIFIDDTSMLTQQAQNLKLASLGRLTASIAHEIRNPLGALSHATQLIKESQSLDAANKDLVEIIENNTLRVNEIIENVMQLSIRKTAISKEINLTKFINTFVADYLLDKSPKPQIEVQFESDDLLVHFDASQLTQILNNLFDNGIRYSQLNTGKPYLLVMIGLEPNNRAPFIDIIDKGQGILPEEAEKIFEPFFTTSSSGTGLGLYISKELCEANRARLDYIPLTSGGSCFRMSFSLGKLPQYME